MTELSETIRELRELLLEAEECRQPETADALFNRSADFLKILEAADKCEAEREARKEAIRLMVEYAEKAGSFYGELALEKEKAERYEKALCEIIVAGESGKLEALKMYVIAEQALAPEQEKEI